MVLPEASDEALREKVKCKRCAASSTRVLVPGSTRFSPRNALETVESETPASMATSCMVILATVFSLTHMT
jgi:hypothetical protein